MLMGSLMVIIGDSLSRSLMSTGEIPQGLFIIDWSAVFYYLLKRREHDEGNY